MAAEITEQYGPQCELRYATAEWPFAKKCRNTGTGQFNIDGEVEWRCDEHAPDESEGVPVP